MHCFAILFDSFTFYNKKYEAKLLAYVFMHNHIHFILFFEEQTRLIDYMRDFKKFTPLKIREHIQVSQPNLVENIAYEHRLQHFKIWTDRYDDVYLYSRDVCEIKIEYMHNNPVRAGLVNNPIDYPFSSAAFYEGRREKSQLIHYRDVF
ncbi:transposase [Spirosoma sp. BT704]|uniref:Transposase n=2 Tax=Spirosoma validum TaxID=2771355 RepID=A0A927B0H2_9BACT|nr:transposase [Spirosoma validum]MBD2753291.1 transposase [Spirosoma validum]